jgi:cell surface protein SprA
MRIFLTKFKNPIVIRFGQLELVRGNWRRYVFQLTDKPDQPELIDLTPLENGNFEVGVVNIQENENRIPIPYRLPPGVERERLQGSTTVQQQNEQSLTVKVTNLAANETRLVYKNTSIDIRMFKKYKIFIHAESVISSDLVEDNEISAIIRLGSDLIDNYYQIEMPLLITELDQNASAEDIWKNRLEAILEDFGKLRLERFASGEPVNIPFIDPRVDSDIKGYTLSVKGNPTLSKIKSMMLGLKNNTTTDKSVELWFNEMRVVDFDNEGGWSAVANVNANFADFADVAVGGSMSTQGFGSLNERVNERSQDDTKQYDIVSNLNLGQLLPKSYGIKLPLNISIAEEFKDPKFDPQYQDVLFEDTDDITSPNRDNATDYTKRRSISLINVRKERTNNKKKQRLYDVENVSVSFAYNDVFHKDYNVEKFNDENVRAGASYNYSFGKGKSMEPFKKSKFLGKKKYLKIIKDFNINPIPTSIAVNSNIIRSYNEQLSRPLLQIEGFPDLPTLERRNFAFDWDYSVAYDLTKSLQFNFRAANSYINDDFDRDISDNNRVIDGQLFDKFFTIGRPEHYTQKLDATYKLPLYKIPILDFINATYNYTADFDWRASSLDNFELIGNTIQNANTHNLNADLNMNKLYKRLGVKKLFRKSKFRSPNTKGSDDKGGKTDNLGDKNGENNVASSPLTGGKDGKGGKGGLTNSKGGKGGKTDNNSRGRGRFKRSKLPFGKQFILGLVDVLTSVKKVRISYTENNGTLLPGYVPEIGFLGRDNATGGLAPTLGFVFGSQSSILNTALSNDWLITRNTADPFFSKTFSSTHFEDLKLNFDVKPAKSLKIDVLANKTFTQNLSQQIDILNDSTDPNYNPFDTPITEVGNFAISNIMIGTSFKDRDELFQEFLNNRSIIAQRLANSTQGDISGYGNNNQSVLLPAFFAAYAGRDVNSVKTSPFRDIPIPNWRISYKGLSKIKSLKKIFRTITLEHNYQSAYSILGFNSNLQFDANNPFPTELENRDAAGNFINKLQFQGVNLVEQFSPLIKLDVKMRNSFSFKGEILKDRSLNLNFANSSITEVDGTEYVIGLGYKLKDIKWIIKTGNQKTTFKGDINFKADFGIRDNETIIRSISNETDQITGGQRIFTLKFTADYNLSKNIMASFFYDQNTSRFKISTTPPRSSVSTGFSLRYNFGN